MIEIKIFPLKMTHIFPCDCVYTLIFEHFPNGSHYQVSFIPSQVVNNPRYVVCESLINIAGIMYFIMNLLAKMALILYSLNN